VQLHIEQPLALAVVGQAVLRGRIQATPQRLKSLANGILAGERRPSFTEWQGEGALERLVAAGVAEWLEVLAAEGVEGLRLHHQERPHDPAAPAVLPPQAAAAFAGGGADWWLLTGKGERGDGWLASWRSPSEHPAGEGRPARGGMVYVRAARDVPLPSLPTEAGLAALRERMLQFLPEIGEFAFRHRLEVFGESFEAAYYRLEEPPGSRFVGRDSLEALLAPEAARLLIAARIAWVFGGMHSWTDVSFAGPTQQRYEALSRELYRLLTAAFVAAVNAGDRAGAS
jgi:hypothetical protein